MAKWWLLATSSDEVHRGGIVRAPFSQRVAAADDARAVVDRNIAIIFGGWQHLSLRPRPSVATGSLLVTSSGEAKCSFPFLERGAAAHDAYVVVDRITGGNFGGLTAHFVAARLSAKC